MEYAIVTDNLCKQFKKVRALDSINIHIDYGTIYGIIGKNGAGKTTLLKILNGMIKQTEGTVNINYNSNRLIGALIEEPGLFYDMTGLENLKVKAYAVGIEDTAELQRILEWVGLSKYKNMKTKNYSLGMKQRLGIALALVGDPEIIILDEPINGLDPQGIAEIRRLILELKVEHKKTIIVSSHILEELFKIGDKYAIINDGKLVIEETKEQLQNRMVGAIHICSENVLAIQEMLHKLKIQNYEILEHKVVIRESNISIWELIKKLVEYDIEIKEIKYDEISYEDLFLDLIGEKI